MSFFVELLRDDGGSPACVRYYAAFVTDPGGYRIEAHRDVA